MDNSFITVMSKQLSGTDFDALDVTAVVLTGLSVVFAGLIILIVLVSIYGKVFENINKKKEQKAKEKLNAENAKKQEAPKPLTKAPDKALAPTVESGIEEETVAVIMAAVSAYASSTGKKLRVAGIKRCDTNGAPARNIWSQAARNELTRPF